MEKYINMSKYAGMREDLVQAGGGNSSCKITDAKMVIKASGYQLADMTEKEGYAVVNYRVVKDAFLNCSNLDEMTEEDSRNILDRAFIEGAKPSIETFLHSITGKYSLHTHPIVVNALTCRKGGEEILLRLFPNAVVVPYATPGVELAKVYFKEYIRYRKETRTEPHIVFLMNHGLMVSADTADDAINLTEEIIKKIEEYLNVDMSAYHEVEKLNDLYPGGITWLVTDKNVLDIYQKLGGIWEHYFCPDCVVFLGKKMYDIKTEKVDFEAFNSFVEKNGYPVIVSYKNHLYIHAESVKKAMEIQSVLSFSAQVTMLNKGIDCNLLEENEKNFLINWDAEKYRKILK